MISKTKRSDEQQSLTSRFSGEASTNNALNKLFFPLMSFMSLVWTRLNRLGKNYWKGPLGLGVNSFRIAYLALKNARIWRIVYSCGKSSGFADGCVPSGWSGSGSVIQDHSAHGVSNVPTNPLCPRIHRFHWCTMIQTDLGSLIRIRIKRTHPQWMDGGSGMNFCADSGLCLSWCSDLGF